MFSNNLFAPKPFGTQTTSFGGTQTNAFGATQPSSTLAFGQTSSFGTTQPSSTLAFGQTCNAINNPFTPKPNLVGGTSTGVFGGTQPSAFGQTNNAGNSPFAPKPFGGASSLFGGTSTNTFGQTNNAANTFGQTNNAGNSPFAPKQFGGGGASSLLGGTSTNTFGQNSNAATPFGGGTPGSFGQNSNAATPFGGGTPGVFGQNNNTATPFGGGTPGSFGQNSNAATPFGGGTPGVFGQNNNAATPFGGGTRGIFGQNNNAATPFGGGTRGIFGQNSNAATPFGGGTSTNVFGQNNTPTGIFGQNNNTPTGIFGPKNSFGQSGSTFGVTQSSPTFTNTQSFPSQAGFGQSGSTFGVTQSSPTFTNTPSVPSQAGFGQFPFGIQQRGSRVKAFNPTVLESSGTKDDGGKFASISAMPEYVGKSHEELRWEDYQLGDKGGLCAPSTQPNTFGAFPSSSQSSANPFLSTTSTFGPSTTNPSTAFGQQSSPSPFTTNPSIFSQSPSIFTSSNTPSIFKQTSASLFNSTTSPLFSNTQSAGLFQTPTTSLAQTSSVFGPSTVPVFGQTSSTQSNGFAGANSTPGSLFNSTTSPLFSNTQSAGLFQTPTTSLAQTSSVFGPSTTPVFGQTNSTQSNGFAGPSLFSGFAGTNSTPSMFLTNQVSVGQTNSIFAPSQPTQTPQVSGSLSSPFNGIGRSCLGQSPASNVSQSTSLPNPFGTLPAIPQLSIGRSGSAPTIKYGISSMPVADKAAPAPVRVSSLLTSRQIPQRRIKLPTRKYHPQHDGPKVPFYSDEETPSNPKADALYLPRENPRALVIRPTRTNTEKASLQKDNIIPVHEDDKSAPTDSNKEHSPENGDFVLRAAPRADVAATTHEKEIDIEALIPKLGLDDYYTEPRVHELAAKERAEPGYCRHVKDFVIGRHGYGSIKFTGETDIRKLDPESIVQFNNREVIVYLDDSKKPPVGQGLNKPAQVTLMNIKCFNKKTGQQCTGGAKVDKYKEMLKKKAREQGAEYMSYDPLKGEWKFSVIHF